MTAKKKTNKKHGGVSRPGAWLDIDQGRSVQGEWQRTPRRVFVSVADGYVDISKSAKSSSPTLVEVPLEELLRALTDGYEK